MGTFKLEMNWYGCTDVNGLKRYKVQQVDGVDISDKLMTIEITPEQAATVGLYVGFDHDKVYHDSSCTNYDVVNVINRQYMPIILDYIQICINGLFRYIEDMTHHQPDDDAAACVKLSYKLKKMKVIEELRIYLDMRYMFDYVLKCCGQNVLVQLVLDADEGDDELIKKIDMFLTETDDPKERFGHILYKKMKAGKELMKEWQK